MAVNIILDNTTGAVTVNTFFLGGNTSGLTNLSAPAAAGVNSLVLPNANGTLILGGESSSFSLSPVITPTQITTDTDDWAPTGYANAKVIRANTSDTWSLGGLKFGSTLCVSLINIGSNTFLLNHNVSTSTAVNRFSLTEDQVSVYSNTKVVLIYDVPLSCWFVNGGERKVGKGFFSGGFAGTYSAVADRTTYATEVTAAVSGANLSLARYGLAAAGNASKGFFSGGFTGTYSAVADRTTYATEVTAAVSGANLSLARYGPAAAGNATKGFFSGGTTGAVSVVADRTTYATEVTAAVSGANLSLARHGLGAAGNATKGFFSGGSTGSDSVVADRTTYATETTVAVSGANLSVAREFLAAAGNATKGFFSGGDTTGGGAFSAVADRTTYATEVTAAVSGANLSLARRSLAAAGNASKGFFSGGTTSSDSAVADRTTYATEVTAAVSGADLSVARNNLAAAGTGIF